MPLIPAMRPSSTINSTEASPISAPPSNAEMGSNAVMMEQEAFQKRDCAED